MNKHKQQQTNIDKKQKNRQTYKQTNRQIEILTNRQIDKQTKRDRQTFTKHVDKKNTINQYIKTYTAIAKHSQDKDSHAFTNIVQNNQAHKHIDHKCKHKQEHHKHRQIDKPANRNIDEQANRQLDKQSNNKHN